MLMYVPIVYGFLPEINVFVFVFTFANRTKKAQSLWYIFNRKQSSSSCHRSEERKNWNKNSGNVVVDAVE